MNIFNSLPFKREILLAFTASSFALAAQGQTLLSQYTLDGSGADAGSLGVDGSLSGSASYASGGVGIFEQALSTGPASTDYFFAETGGNFGLSAITITMWVNVDAGASSDRLISNISSSSGGSGFDLYLQNYSAGTGAGGADEFRLSFGINSTSGAVQSISSNYVSDKWLFLAVTYDSGIGSDNVLFYSGDEATSIGLNSTLTHTGSIVASPLDLEIGGTPVTTGDRSPTALFNDVRVYSGILDSTELEAVRVSTIPEPSTYALIFGVALTALVGLQRRHRA